MVRSTKRRSPKNIRVVARQNSSAAIGAAAITAILGVLFSAAGCEKPPSMDELLHGKKAAPAAKAAPTTAPAPATPVAAAPAKPPEPPPKPKKTPQEILAEFKSTPPQKRTNELMHELGALPQEDREQFTEMDLTHSTVDDSGLAELPKLDHVEKLNLDWCLYSNDSLKDIAKMKSLTNLSMVKGPQKSPNIDKGLENLTGMTQLKDLKLNLAKISPDAMMPIGRMTWLEGLSFDSTFFQDSNLILIKELSGLKRLSVSGTNVSDNISMYLLPFSNLEVLGLSNLNPNFRGACLKAMAESGKVKKDGHAVHFE